jgi:hypothetical protein
MAESSIEMFEPTSRDMKLDYPELSEIEEFKSLNARELKFCWYVGSRTSPFANMDKKKRLSIAASTAWGGYHTSKKSVRELAEGKLSEKIISAITKMSSFNPSVRLRAKFMQEYIFEKMQTIIVISPEEMAELDADDKKKYAELALKVSSELGNVVQRMELGYGVKARSKKSERAKEVKRSLSDIVDKIE